VVVEDSGEGIEDALLPHVFDRFVQSETSTTRRHGGLGLGLAIAMTGFASQQDQEAALRAGFDEHVGKPVEPEALLARLGALTERAPDQTLVIRTAGDAGGGGAGDSCCPPPAPASAIEPGA
jgi:hypothetical protein